MHQSGSIPVTSVILRGLRGGGTRFSRVGLASFLHFEVGLASDLDFLPSEMKYLVLTDSFLMVIDLRAWFAMSFLRRRSRGSSPHSLHATTTDLQCLILKLVVCVYEPFAPQGYHLTAIVKDGADGGSVDL